MRRRVLVPAGVARSFVLAGVVRSLVLASVARSFAPAGVACSFAMAGVVRSFAMVAVARSFVSAGVARSLVLAGVVRSFALAGVVRSFAPAGAARPFMTALAAGLFMAAIASGPVAAARAAAPPPAWSFAAPLGGFDLGAAQRGFGVYEQRCASCHGMAALAPVDLLGLGFDRRAARDVLHKLGHPPFTAGNGAPDLSRTVRVIGPDATWRLVLAPAGPVAYNGLPAGHPVLASRGEARDLVTFLAWAAQPHLTARRQVGVAILLFGLLALGLARRRSRHGRD